MRRKSITKQITVLTVIFLLGSVSIAFIASTWFNARHTAGAYREQLAKEIQILADGLGQPLWSFDYATARGIGAAYAASGDVTRLTITSVTEPAPVFHLRKPGRSEELILRQDIIWEGEVIGSVEAALSTGQVAASVTRTLYYSVPLMILLSALMIGAVRVTLRIYLGKPISILTEWTSEVSRGNYDAAIEGAIDNQELEPVASQFQSMSSKIAEREAELGRHLRLQENLSRIQQTHVAHRGWEESFSAMLDTAIGLTGSSAGLLAEVMGEQGGSGRLLLHAHSDMNSNPSAPGEAPQGALDGSIMMNLANQAIGRGETVIQDELALPDSSDGAVHGLALPLRQGREIVGVLTILRERLAYSRRDIEFLKPLLGACGSMVSAMRSDLALRKSEDINKAVLEGSMIGIVTAGPNCRVVDINPFALSLFGYSREELLGADLLDALLAEEHRAHYRQALHELFLTGLNTQLGCIQQVTATKAGGITFPANLIFTFHQEEQLVTAVFRDLTEEKASEEALLRGQKMEAIGQLTGGIAHDFSNILGIVVGNLDFLMSAGRSEEETKRRLASAYKASMRAIGLTRQLLTFAKRQPSRAEAVDVNKAIRNVGDLLERSSARDIEVRFSLAPEAWQAYIDPGELQDALLNLALNSRDAMLSGGTLTIETANAVLDEQFARRNPQVQPGEYVEIAFSDTGCGIDQDHLPHIFEPFYTTKDQGSGLGLSMVFGFVSRSRGHIQVYSQAGVGTTFRLFLPRYEASDPERPPSKSPAPDIPAGTETVLVVEDESDLRILAKDMLQELGYRVLVAADARSGLEQLRSGPPVDLLFSDVVMPGGMNGYQLAQAVQRNWPGLRILLTSGFTGATLTEASTRDPALRVLPKPYSKAQLAGAIREELENAGQHG